MSCFILVVFCLVTTIPHTHSFFILTIWLRAPSLITSREHPKAREALWADAVDAVVAPATAFGGAGVLSLAEQVHETRIITGCYVQRRFDFAADDSQRCVCVSEDIVLA